MGLSGSYSSPLRAGCFDFEVFIGSPIVERSTRWLGLAELLGRDLRTARFDGASAALSSFAASDEFEPFTGAFRSNSLAPPKKAGVLSILGVLVALGSLGVLVSHYLPLYRAHETLNGEYVKLANHGREQQEQLEQTVTALKRTAADRDQLKAAQGSARLDAEAARANLVGLTKALTAELAAQTEKKLIALSSTEAVIEIQFQSPTLFRNDASAPTPLGKEVLCRIARAADKAAVKYSVIGAASISDTKQRALKAFPSPWHLSVARGASAAQLVDDACKVAPNAILASGIPSTERTPAALLTLKLSL